MKHRTTSAASAARRPLSRPLRFLTSQKDTPPADLAHRAALGILAVLQGTGDKLQLSRRLSGSLFLHPSIFLLLTLGLAPFLPTMALLALCCGSILSLVLSAGAGELETGRYSPTLRGIGLLAAVYLLATLLSVAPKESLYPGLLMAVFVLFAYSCYVGIARYGTLRRAFTLICLGGVAVSLYGFFQRLNPGLFESGWVDEDMFSSITFRVYSTFSNPNVLGEYFLLVIPFSFALTLSAKNLRKKVLWALATAGMLGCMLLTYSRGCYLGLLLAAAIFLVLLDRRFLILLGVAILLSPLYVPDSIWQRVLSIGDLGDTSTNYRVSIWIGSLQMLKDFWFCGVGPGEGAFNTVYPIYSLSAIDAPHAHSLYLQLLCDTGLPGLLVFLGVIGSLFRSLCTTLRRSRRRETKLFAMAGISAFSGFLLQSLTDYSFYNYRLTLIFFGLMGLCLLLRQEERLFGDDALALRSREKPLVLHILSDSNLGGAGQYLLNLFSAYDREAYQMALALPRGGALAEPARALGIPVYELDMPGDKSLSLRCILPLRQLLLLVEPEIVQTHGSMSGRIAARATGAKILFTRHSVFPVSPRLSHGLGHVLSRRVNRHYGDLALAVSPAAAENLQDMGLRPGEIATVMNGGPPAQGATPEEAAALRQQYGLERDTFTGGLFARLEPYKGQKTVLEAAKLLRAQGRRFRILLCGQGSDREALAEQIAADHLEDCVSLPGFVRPVGPLLSLMDVQISASTGTEATSLALIEGMSLGLPTVASRYGGTPYLIHDGQEGLLFPPGDAQALAQCLGRLMDDPALRERLAQGAREAYAEHYTAQCFARGVEQVYGTLLGKEAL